MPDRTIDQRVTDLEADVATLKDEWANIPELIEVRLRLTDSRVARLSSDMSAMKRAFTELSGKVADLSGKVEALPRTLAEMVAELSGKVDALPATLERMLAERDKKR